VLTVSFLPIFALGGESGRLFRPLAFTKTFAMGGAALLSITLIPILMVYFIRGKIIPDMENPVARATMVVYKPVVRVIMRFPKIAIFLALIAMAVTLYPLSKLGSEFMPPLDEGDLDNAAVIKSLADTNYSGWITAELDAWPDPKDGAVRSLAFMKRTIAGA